MVLLCLGEDPQKGILSRALQDALGGTIFLDTRPLIVIDELNIKGSLIFFIQDIQVRE